MAILCITLGDSGSDLNLVFLRASSDTSSGRGVLSRSCWVGAEVQVPGSMLVGTRVRAPLVAGGSVGLVDASWPGEGGTPCSCAQRGFHYHGNYVGSLVVKGPVLH